MGPSRGVVQGEDNNNLGDIVVNQSNWLGPPKPKYNY